MDVPSPKINDIKALQMILKMDKKANVFMITDTTKSMIVQESINF